MASMQPVIFPLALVPMVHREASSEQDSQSSCLIHTARNAAAQKTFAAKRPLVRLLCKEDATDHRHSWGDFVLGGGLGMLALACELGSPALVRRCLAHGCCLTWRDWVVAWRKEQVEVLWILEQRFGFQRRPWPDPGVERRLMEYQARQLQARLERHTDRANGAGHAERL